ncbi:DUF3617 domain-containing protein [uncultured Sphingomonas sp.]|uniref:DUF3617 domain-containing protein n=1 Tax=uncultured Sphingomonas sp. TaxID=158754 RepID=UPI0025E1D287|nr:DUF3617 domain-containing protein [uncultured Sphingomonas sp.]
MKPFIPLMAVAALSLAACDQKTGSTTVTSNAATGEVKETETGAGSPVAKLQPGKWEIKTQVSDLKMENMPKGVSSTPPAATNTVCLTAEQAAKGPAELLKGAQSDCTVTSSTFAGGKVESDLTCKLPGNMTMKSKTKGTFTDTSFSTDQEMEMSGAHAMSQKVHSEGRRIGECDAAK